MKSLFARGDDSNSDVIYPLSCRRAHREEERPLENYDGSNLRSVPSNAIDLQLPLLETVKPSSRLSLLSGTASSTGASRRPDLMRSADHQHVMNAFMLIPLLICAFLTSGPLSRSEGHQLNDAVYDIDQASCLHADVSTHFESLASVYDRDLAELVAIPSVSALPDHLPDILRASTWLSSRLQKAGLQVIMSRVC